MEEIENSIEISLAIAGLSYILEETYNDTQTTKRRSGSAAE